MTIEEYLGQIAENSESYFQAHLAKEDLLRVERLSAMAAATSDLETLQKEALYSGWTPGDLRTGELKDVLLPLIAAFHARAHPESRADPRTSEKRCCTTPGADTRSATPS